jgi:choline dehydrogenase-like flavoprotein
MMDHCATNGATGVHFGFTDRGTAGKRPNGIYIPRFRNVDDEDADFLRGYGYQGVSDRAGWTRFVSTPGFGKSLKDQLGQHGPWYMRLTGFGECLPRYDNAVALDRTHHDRWGIPQLKIAFQFGDNERKMAKDMAEQAAAMLGAAGFVGVSPFMEMSDAIHEMGTARMGRDPRESVLNAHNQCHDVRNVYVTDGACMTSSSCVNPSLTYMALTARAAAHAADELARGAL